MHTAPSVTYPVGRSRWAAAILLLVWLVGVVVTLGWTAQPGVALSRMVSAWLAMLAGALWTAWMWWHAPRGELAWDGSSWRRTGPDGATVAGNVRVAVDLQRHLLLEWRGAGARCWLWLDRTSAMERWDDLRRAVYSRARPALPVASPPAAKP